MHEYGFQEKHSALLKLSHELGREDRYFAILAEGNVSARISEDNFLVKASGSTLATLQERDLVQCNMKVLLPLLDKTDLCDADMETSLLASRTDSKSRKPSIETLFHVYLLKLPKIEFVAHTHPLDRLEPSKQSLRLGWHSESSALTGSNVLGRRISMQAWRILDLLSSVLFSS